MGEQRFFLKNIDPTARRITFPKDISHQIQHVLRLQRGSHVTVLDGEGKSYQVEIDSLEKDIVGAKVIRVGEVKSPLPIRIVLFFPLSRREKVEWILQKGTEVGVSAFHPFVSGRSLVQSTAINQKKMSRWEAIIREAAEQSGRVVLPRLHPPQKLSRIIRDEIGSHDFDVVLAASVAEKEQGLASALDRFQLNAKDPSIGLFIGAEGGFLDVELELIGQAGIQTVSLGVHVLRLETAAIVFPALVIQHLCAKGSSE